MYNFSRKLLKKGSFSQTRLIKLFGAGTPEANKKDTRFVWHLKKAFLKKIGKLGD
jgi:hypothetical protein